MIKRLTQHPVEIFLVAWGIFVILPFFAPVFMHLNWQTPARLIYAVYSSQCHALPQRTLFLFGPQLTYTLSEIQAAGYPVSPFLVAREFIGTPEMGWKVAQCERSNVMYASLWLMVLAYQLKWLPQFKLGIGHLILLLLPLGIDGISHAISDTMAPLGGGFRDTNLWLATLTQFALPNSFYMGDGLGSFNSWMRILSGVLFGIGLTGFAFPRLTKIFASDPPNNLQT